MRGAHLALERPRVGLVTHRKAERFADSDGLRQASIDLCRLTVLHCQAQLTEVMLMPCPSFLLSSFAISCQSVSSFCRDRSIISFHCVLSVD